MPIYAYRCSTCGNAKDVLQKMSDPVLTVCPFCGASTFIKQVTAAGFQLKGSGWYVTDFRGGDKPSAATSAESKSSGDDAGTANADSSSPSSSSSANSDSSTASMPVAAPSSSPSSSSVSSSPSSSSNDKK